MKLTLKNTKAELFAALESTKEVHEQRTALAYIAIFFFITTVLF